MPDHNEIMAAARTLYEGTHGMTLGDLADTTGVAKRTLTGWARDDGWAKLLETKTGKTTDAALAAREFFAARAATAVAVPEEDNPAVRVMTDPLPAEREELLKRHRAEWIAPRAMSSEAVKLRNADPFKAMERAKLAKITSETLKIVQDGERKAYGLDLGVDVPAGHVVVIERA